jgi:CRP-like cAMP-binding protein
MKDVKVLNEGSTFGELALMYSCPRTATVVALTDCSLWAMD